MPTLTADGAGDPVSMKGHFTVHASGTFGGGQITLQFLAADTNWKDLEGGPYTGAIDKIVQLPDRREIRINLSGATTPSLYYEIRAGSK